MSQSYNLHQGGIRGTNRTKKSTCQPDHAMPGSTLGISIISASLKVIGRCTQLAQRCCQLPRVQRHPCGLAPSAHGLIH